MPRSILIVSLAALVGIAGVLTVPARMFATMAGNEADAVSALARVDAAQRAFERAAYGGYASDLATLTTPCPGESEPLLRPDELPAEYELFVRAAAGAVERGRDCHGRPVVSDYYASAAPRDILAGLRAYAMTSRGRIHMFFDGVPPRERDFQPQGLAVPVDTLSTFEIP